MSNQTSKQKALLDVLKYLQRHYVGLLEHARDRILSLGGKCDLVDVMEQNDPHLRQVREVIASVEATQDETSARWPLIPERIAELRGRADVLEATLNIHECRVLGDMLHEGLPTVDPSPDDSARDVDSSQCQHATLTLGKDGWHCAACLRMFLPSGETGAEQEAVRLRYLLNGARAFVRSFAELTQHPMDRADAMKLIERIDGLRPIETSSPPIIGTQGKPLDTWDWVEGCIQELEWFASRKKNLAEVYKSDSNLDGSTWGDMLLSDAAELRTALRHVRGLPPEEPIAPPVQRHPRDCDCTSCHYSRKFSQVKPHHASCGCFECAPKERPEPLAGLMECKAK